MKNALRVVGYLGFMSLVLVGVGGVAEANHSWGSYHWARATNPFTLTLGDNLTSSWDSYLAQTSSDWTASVVLDTVIAPGNTNNTKGRNTPKSCTPTAGRGEVCNAKYGSNGWLGIASIWASGNHITAGTVKLNDTYFNTTKYKTSEWKNLVMCQEVGHIFGLGHQDETFDNPNLDTCMDYTNNPASNQHPNAHDYELLESIYEHLDANTTVSQSAGTALASDSNDPKAWGKEVHRSENGRASVFVQDAGEGNRVIRHVYWAEPRGGEHHHHD
jgi:hypothetical protein